MIIIIVVVVIINKDGLHLVTPAVVAVSYIVFLHPLFEFLDVGFFSLHAKSVFCFVVNINFFDDYVLIVLLRFCFYNTASNYNRNNL